MINIGDVVTIKPDLSIKDEFAGSPGYVMTMEKYRGRKVTVRKVSNGFFDVALLFHEVPYSWSYKWVIEGYVLTDVKEITPDEIDDLIKGD